MILAISRPTTRNTTGTPSASFDTTSRNSSKKMIIRPVGQEGGVEVPYAPREVTYSNLSDTYSEVSRVGQSPLVVKESEGVNRMAFTLFLGSIELDRSIAHIIRKLELYAQKESPLKVDYSSMEEGQWHISSMSASSVHRRPGDHEVVQASVDIEFVRSTGGADGIGPVSGGVGKGKDKDEGGNVVKYAVRSGDTLHSIANKFFKDASRWKDIADWNDIQYPNKDLKVGRILEIRTRKVTVKGGK